MSSDWALRTCTLVLGSAFEVMRSTWRLVPIGSHATVICRAGTIVSSAGLMASWIAAATASASPAALMAATVAAADRSIGTHCWSFTLISNWVWFLANIPVRPVRAFLSAVTSVGKGSRLWLNPAGVLPRLLMGFAGLPGLEG